MEKTNNELVKYVQKIKELEVKEKDEFITMLKNGQDPVEILDKIEDKLQEKLDGVFEEAGVELDENDPEYKAKQKEMMDEFQEAEKEFGMKMSHIAEEAEFLQKDVAKQIERQN